MFSPFRHLKPAGRVRSFQPSNTFIWKYSLIVRISSIAASLSSLVQSLRLFHNAFSKSDVNDSGVADLPFMALMSSISCLMVSTVTSVSFLISSMMVCRRTANDSPCALSRCFQSLITKRALAVIFSAAAFLLPASSSALRAASSVLLDDVSRSRKEKSAVAGIIVSASSARI